MTCLTSQIDQHLLFNFSSIPDRIVQITIKSKVESDLYSSYSSHNHASDEPEIELVLEHFVIPPNAFVSLKNIVNMNFLSASISKLDIRAFAGTELVQFSITESTFLEFSFEALEDVAASLQAILIYKLKVPDLGLYPLSLRSFPMLKAVSIVNLRPQSSEIQISAYNLSSLETMKITNNPNLKQIPSGSLVTLPKVTNLDLSVNYLYEIPPDVSDLQSLEVLNLGHNVISDIEDFNFMSQLNSLKELRLYGNDIRTVTGKAVEILKQLTSLKTFYMGNNPFNCTCELKSFAVWLKDTYVDVGFQWHFPRNGIPYKSSDFDGNEPSYKCVFPPDLLDRSVLVLSEKNCTPPEVPETKNSSSSSGGGNNSVGFWSPMMTGIIASVISIGFLIVIAVGISFGVMIYRKIGRRRNVGIFPLIDDNYNCENEEIAHEFHHDAYICHHDNLVEFVVYNFMPRLEREPNNLRLCLSFRDFLVGADKLDNITNAFETCRTTIFLVDNDFVNSNQCMLELKICCSYLLDDDRPANAKQNGMILILLDAIPRDLMPTTLRVLMNKITYLEWDRLDNEKCWVQLEASLRKIKAQEEI